MVLTRSVSGVFLHRNSLFVLFKRGFHLKNSLKPTLNAKRLSFCSLLAHLPRIWLKASFKTRFQKKSGFLCIKTQLLLAFSLLKWVFQGKNSAFARFLPTKTHLPRSWLKASFKTRFCKKSGFYA